jgi:hypothetical protein
MYLSWFDRYLAIALVADLAHCFYDASPVKVTLTAPLAPVSPPIR